MALTPHVKVEFKSEFALADESCAAFYFDLNLLLLWAFYKKVMLKPIYFMFSSCRYGHMIDNVVLIVTGTLHERDVQELLEKCHPLGMFDRYSKFYSVFNTLTVSRWTFNFLPLSVGSLQYCYSGCCSEYAGALQAGSC